MLRIRATWNYGVLSTIPRVTAFVIMCLAVALGGSRAESRSVVYGHVVVRADGGRHAWRISTPKYARRIFASPTVLSATHPI